MLITAVHWNRQDFIIAKFSLITHIILMLNEWVRPHHFCTKWDISRVSTVGLKAAMLVHARARCVSTVTSGALSCLIGASLEPTARVLWPAETLGQNKPARAWRVAMNKGGQSDSTTDYFIKLTAITPELKTLKYFELKTTFQTVQRVWNQLLTIMYLFSNTLSVVKCCLETSALRMS